MYRPSSTAPHPNGSGRGVRSRLAIDRENRDALRKAVLLDLRGLNDLMTFIEWKRMTEARGYRDRFMHAMRLLDDLGWEEQTDLESFELTMPQQELAALIQYFDEVAEEELRHTAENLLVASDPEMTEMELDELKRCAREAADQDLDTRAACRAVRSIFHDPARALIPNS